MIWERCLCSRSGRATYQACLKTYLFVLFKATIWPMSGRVYKFTRNFHVPCSAQILCLETSCRDQRWWKHISCLQAQCADFMGSRSCQCRIIMKWSVSARVQACFAFQVEWGRKARAYRGHNGCHVSSNRWFRSESCPRAPVINM